MEKTTNVTINSSSLWPLDARISNADDIDRLSHDLATVFDHIVDDEQLENEFYPQFSRLYLPLADWVAHKHSDKPIVIGINGAQGSGKSTLTKILKAILSQAFNKSVIELSIDDLYLSREHREKLANDIHPLLKTRGVPGTHNIEYAHKIFSTLLDATPGLEIKLPIFDKAADDLLPEEDWLSINNNVDIILFEGWCVGAKAEDNYKLDSAVNELEEKEDPDLSWRTYINTQLQNSYQDLFQYIDYQLMLKVPDMNSVFEWRSLQEKKLALSHDNNDSSAKRIMSDSELVRFIMHYERITLSTLNEMPGRADVVLYLDHDHQVSRVGIKGIR